MDGTYAATVDRIVDGETAVLLLEADGDIVEQLGVPAERLPEPAQRDGVLSVTIEDDELVSAEYLAEETRDRRGSLRGRLERLSKRLSDPD